MTECKSPKHKKYTKKLKMYEYDVNEMFFLITRCAVLIVLTLGMLRAVQTRSASRRSRISQAKLVGHWRL